MFSDLTHSDYDTLIHYFSPQRHRLCYYSLSSLIVWKDTFSKPVWKIDCDSLIVGKLFLQNSEKNYLLLPIANGRELSPVQLYKIALSSGISKYQFIPEDYVTGHNYTDLNHLFTIIEQPEYEDYIYNTSDLSELKGKKYSKKRNLNSQIEKAHLNSDTIKTMPLMQKDIP